MTGCGIEMGNSITDVLPLLLLNFVYATAITDGADI
jgi:hypothetical protein